MSATSKIVLTTVVIVLAMSCSLWVLYAMLVLLRSQMGAA